MPEQITQKAHDGRGVHVVLRVGAPVETEVAALGGDAQGRDGGHLVPVAAEPGEHGGYPPRRPGAAHQGVQEEAALVDEDESGLLGPGFFWMRGQSSWTHFATAAPSCSSARWAGFCALCLRWVSQATR